MPVGYAAAASAVGGIASGLIGAGAAKSAAAQQAAAQQNAMAFQSAMYANNLKLLTPYINQGYAAQNRVNAIFGLGGPAPAAAPTAAPTAAPAPAATPGAALASTGFTPSGSLPAGYSVQQVGGGEGEGPSRMVVTNSGGGIVSELPGVALGDTAGANVAALAALQGQGLAPAATAATPAATAAGDATGTAAAAAPASTTSAGALAGPGSAVAPYAAPNGGVFDPLGGNLTGGFSFNPTVADLENTPGYKFMLDQGLRAAQNSAAARGLGLSGAAMKGGIDYATGAADSNWKDVYNAELSKYTTNRDTFAQNWDRQRQQFGTNLDASLGLNQQYYNTNIAPILNLQAQGMSAIGGATNAGNAASGQISNALTGIGNAQAAGTVGSANALTGGLTGATNSIQQAVFLNKLFGNSGGGSGGAASGVPVLPVGAGGTAGLPYSGYVPNTLA